MVFLLNDKFGTSYLNDVEGHSHLEGINTIYLALRNLIDQYLSILILVDKHVFAPVCI